MVLMRQNFTEQPYTEPSIPHTHIYQSWPPQRPGWPAVQLGPTLPGFDECEKQLHTTQTGPPNMHSSGILDPSETMLDEPGHQQNPKENCLTSAAQAHVFGDTTHSGAGRSWYHSRLAGVGRDHLHNFTAAEDFSRAYPCGATQQLQQEQEPRQLHDIMPTYSGSQHFPVGSAPDVDTRFEASNCRPQCDVSSSYPAYACNEDLYHHQQGEQYHQQLYQEHSTAIGWPVHQTHDTLPMPAGGVNARQQLFADGLQQENADPAQVSQQQQRQQQQQKQAQEQRPQARPGSRPITAPSAQFSGNGEALLAQPSRYMQHQPVSALLTARPGTGIERGALPDTSSGRTAVTPTRATAEAVLQSTALSSSASKGELAQCAGHVADPSQCEVRSKGLDTEEQPPEPQALLHSALLKLLKQHLVPQGVQRLPQRQQTVSTQSHAQQTQTQQSAPQPAQTCAQAAQSRSAETLVYLQEAVSQQTQTDVLSGCHIMQCTQTDPQLWQQACRETQTSPQPQLSQQTQTESSPSQSSSQETQTPLLHQQGVSTQTQDAPAVVQSTQQTETEPQVQQAASTQTLVASQQAAWTQTSVASQQAVSTQTPVLTQLPAWTQTAVPVTDAACQSSSHDEQASAAQQRLEEMQGEVTGLQLKVESLQGIVDIQEQQLQAAAGQTADQAEAPLEKQISRWRQEVFKLLLFNKQAQQAHHQQSGAQTQVIARLEQQLAAAEDQTTLLNSRVLDRCVDLDLVRMKSKRAEEQLQHSNRQSTDLQAELKHEKQLEQTLVQAIQQANAEHLTATASLAQAEGRMATFIHRLGYAEARLRFALQLQQPAVSDPACSTTPGALLAVDSSPGVTHGTSSSLTSSLSAEVLHLEVQRLAADRAMLVQSTQALAEQAKADLSRAVAAAHEKAGAVQEQQVAARVAAHCREMEAQHSAELSHLRTQHSAELRRVEADSAAHLTAAEVALDQERQKWEQAIIESHRQLEQVTADYQVHAAHAAQAAAERTAALQHAVDSLQAALDSAKLESQSASLEQQQQSSSLRMQLQQEQDVLRETKQEMAAMQRTQCEEQHSLQQQHAEEMVAVQTELDASQRDLRKAQQLLRQLERQLAKSHVSRKDSATISQQMQELQADKEDLERQLRMMRQERNALAVTLRQHGFLGRTSTGRTSTGKIAAVPVQDLSPSEPRAARHEHTAHQHAGDNSCCSSSAASPLSSGPHSRHRQQGMYFELKNAQIPEVGLTNPCQPDQQHGNSTLRDVTNVNASIHTSPGVRFYMQTPDSVSRSSTRLDTGTSTQCVDAHNTMQAKLQKLDEMAQMLLM